MRSLILTLTTALASLTLAACGGSSSTSSSSTTTSSAASTPASASSASSSATSSSSSGTAPSGPVRSGHLTVAITNYAFHPAALVVKQGTKITFVNHDTTAHTATAGGGGFDSGTIKPGASAVVTFGKPGHYPYICQFHAFMHGTIVVK